MTIEWAKNVVRYGGTVTHPDMQGVFSCNTATGTMQETVKDENGVTIVGFWEVCSQLKYMQKNWSAVKK